MKNLSPLDSHRLAHHANRMIHHLGVIVAPPARGFGRPESLLGKFHPTLAQARPLMWKSEAKSCCYPRKSATGQKLVAAL